MSLVNNDNATGTCFTDSVAIVTEMIRNGAALDTLRLVHGAPIGSGEHNKGKRFWHAWVEITDPDRPVVLTVVAGELRAVERRDFYKYGHLDNSWVIRHRVEDVIAHLDAFGHAGPWTHDADADALNARVDVTDRLSDDEVADLARPFSEAD